MQNNYQKKVYSYMSLVSRICLNSINLSEKIVTLLLGQVEGHIKNSSIVESSFDHLTISDGNQFLLFVSVKYHISIFVPKR